MKSKKNIAILGSTGSIGTQTLDVISAHPDKFETSVLIAGHNVDLLIEQSVKFRPRLAVIADHTKYSRLKDALAPIGIEVAAGSDQVAAAMEMDCVDTVVTATVGYSGLEPTLHAIAANKRIALANKETLVVAGELVTGMLEKSSSSIIPVDSEHSAIYQCLAGEDPESVERLIITASGGPFRNRSCEELRYVTVSDALHHPNWAMGAKITIDSATMINKAFEIIEARWLFGVGPEKIEAVVHPQSIVHSMVQFVDGAVKAQLGLPDMRLPIRYALGDATRIGCSDARLSVSDFRELTFESPDFEKFPCLSLAYRALEAGGTTACSINAANEVAVAAFLDGRIRFTDIYPIIEQTLEASSFVAAPVYDDYVSINAEARTIASQLVKNKFEN